jgi:hypothetical protein
MWTIDFVLETIQLKQDMIRDKEDFIREAEYSRDLTDAVRSRAHMLERLTKLEEIRDEMKKCEETSAMNDYIAQKALVYTLIEKYKSTGNQQPSITI